MNPCIKHVAALLHVSGPESSSDLVFREHVVAIAMSIKNESDAMAKEIAALRMAFNQFYDAAALAEREACAELFCPNLGGYSWELFSHQAQAAIRARGGK